MFKPALQRLSLGRCLRQNYNFESLDEKEKMTRYLEASENMAFKIEEVDDILCPLDYFKEDERKIFELFEVEFERNYPYIMGLIFNYFFDYQHGELPRKFETQYEYRENLLENIDYFKFKHKIKTNYKHKNSPF